MNKELQFLGKYYSNLEENLVLEKGKKFKSLIFSLMKTTSNTRFSILENSSLQDYRTPDSILSKLKSEGLIRDSSKIGRSVITAKGIHRIEKLKGILEEDTIVSHIDREYFDLPMKIGSLSDKEKVILFSMVAIRAFSEDSTIDLKKGGTVLNAIQKLLEEAYDFLNKNRFIGNLDKSDLYGKRGNEHPVSNLIRHTVDLPKKTRGVYKCEGQQRYFLDLYKGSSVEIDKLAYLFFLVFSKKAKIEIKSEIENFCNKIPYELSVYIFEMRNHKFAKPSFDKIISGSITEYFLKKNFWSE